MDVTNKKSRSRSPSSPKAAEPTNSGHISRGKLSDSSTVKDAFIEVAPNAILVPNTTLSAPAPVSTQAGSGPRSTIIEKVRLEALMLRINEATVALKQVVQDASTCNDEAEIKQISLQDLVSTFALIEKNPTREDLNKSAKIQPQMASCAVIRNATSHLIDDCAHLRDALITFEKKVSSYLPLDPQDNPSANIRMAKKRLQDDEQILAPLIPIAQDDSMQPLLKLWSDVSAASTKAYDLALAVVRDMRVLHLLAAKYA